jgi:hypothetical protein
MAQKNIVTGLHLGHRMFYLTELPMLHGGNTCHYRDEGIRLIISSFVRNGIFQKLLFPDLKYFYFYFKAFTLKYNYFYYNIFCYVFENELEWCSPEEDYEFISWHPYIFINFSFFTFWIFKSNEWYIIYCQVYLPKNDAIVARKLYRKLAKLFINYYTKCTASRVYGTCYVLRISC